MNDPILALLAYYRRNILGPVRLNHQKMGLIFRWSRLKVAKRLEKAYSLRIGIGSTFRRERWNRPQKKALRFQGEGGDRPQILA